MSERKTVVCHRAVKALMALALFSIAILLTGCSTAKGRIVKIEGEHDARLVDGDMDYGILVTVTITNDGDADPLRITTELSCSEGEWERTQSLHFDAGETKKLTYFFHEPSINATNIQYSVTVFPKASQK
jgi:hypothetical protein